MIGINRISTQNDRVLLIGLYFPKAVKGQCGELLGDLFDENTFDDGIPLPSGSSFDFETQKDDDDNNSSTDSDSEDDDWQIQHTSKFDVSIHVAQIVFGVCLMIIACVSVVIYFKGKDYILQKIQEKASDLIGLIDQKKNETIQQAREMIGGRMHWKKKK